MIVLDTDIVTLHSYGKTEKLKERIAAVKDDDLAVSIITRMEILRGRFDNIVTAATQEELKKAMERFVGTEILLARFTRVDVDDAAREHFGNLLQGKKTKKMRRKDMLIACIALGQKALLVTRNVKDYKDVQGLKVENWAD